MLTQFIIFIDCLYDKFSFEDCLNVINQDQNHSTCQMFMYFNIIHWIFLFLIWSAHKTIVVFTHKNIYVYTRKQNLYKQNELMNKSMFWSCIRLLYWVGLPDFFFATGRVRIGLNLTILGSGRVLVLLGRVQVRVN